MPIKLMQGNEACVEGAIIAADAKVNLDDNALFRHPDIVQLRDLNEEDAKEVEASRYDLDDVSLDGSVGCMVNGAGLAMAAMDIIKSFGGEPANFLDVGGSATAEKETAAFKILLSDPNVKTILVNIFGGKGIQAGKVAALEAAGVLVAPTPDKIGATLIRAIQKAGIYEKCVVA